MAITVRKIREDDIEGFRSALAVVSGEGRFILTIEPPPLEKMQAFVRNNIEKNHPHYVCEDGGQIIGWAVITPYSRQTMTHVGGLGMGVVPERRGQGLGRKLLEAVLADAWKVGLKRIELEVFTDNHSAIALYQSVGFETEGIKKYARYHRDAFQDIAVMAQYRVG